MKYIWLGHASVRLEVGGEVLLIDPWETGNPTFPADQRTAAFAGATAILVTHGHSDHTNDVVALSKELGVKIYCIVELATWWGERQGADVVGFNKGGTVQIGDVAVSMVDATHSSSMQSETGAVYAGVEAGFMIEGDGKTIYISGDTDVMADMAVLNDLHQPQIGVLCAGGHFTMDMKRAAYAASKLFNFETVIPYHYGTFPLLEQSADALVAALPGVNVLAPSVMEVVEL
jgi:L-ascorbate metabolism protein UlaG (beta-lactamase superfamily)